MFLVSPPTETPFNPSEVPTVINVPRELSLTIPDVDVSFLNAPPESYVVSFQGFLFADDVLAIRRRKRQPEIVAMTEILTEIFPISSTRTIVLSDLLPNYQYVVDVSIRTSDGQTPPVRIMPPSLISIGRE